MRAFLSWYGEQSYAGEEGGRESPPLEGDELEAWVFYCRAATPLSAEFGLMPMLLDRTGLKGVDLTLFISRLSLIHSEILKLRSRSEENHIASTDTMYAEERT